MIADTNPVVLLIIVSVERIIFCVSRSTTIRPPDVFAESKNSMNLCAHHEEKGADPRLEDRIQHRYAELAAATIGFP
jgi:hypothetical protein